MHHGGEEGAGGAFSDELSAPLPLPFLLASPRGIEDSARRGAKYK